MPIRIRLRASAGAARSQSGFGTTPNMAPPSSAKNPSLSGTSSRLPSAIDGARMSGAPGQPVRSARTRVARRIVSEALDDVARRGVGIERARADRIDHRGPRVGPEAGVHARHETGGEQLAQAELAPRASALTHGVRRLEAEAIDGLQQFRHARAGCGLGFQNRRPPPAGSDRLEAEHRLDARRGAVRAFAVW